MTFDYCVGDKRSLGMFYTLENIPGVKQHTGKILLRHGGSRRRHHGVFVFHLAPFVTVHLIVIMLHAVMISLHFIAVHLSVVAIHLVPRHGGLARHS